MKVDKSLQEVWEWKDKVYEATKHMTMHERGEYIRKGADRMCKKHNLHLREAPTKSRV